MPSSIGVRRRDFLTTSGLALGTGALLSSCARPQAAATPAAAAPPVARAAPAPGDWAAIKAEFNLNPDLAHMAGFFLVSHPRGVRDAIDAHRRGLDDSPYEYIEANIARIETAQRAAAAEYAGAAPHELAMTDSTTMGLGVVYGGMRLRPGQEILSTTHDHMVTTQACQHRADRTGAAFRRVPLYDDPARASTPAI